MRKFLYGTFFWIILFIIAIALSGAVFYVLYILSGLPGV